MLINGALTCWNMKNWPAIWRLHRRTHRMTDCTTFLLPTGRKTLQWNVRLIRDPRSASRWRCRSVFKIYAALVWYSSNLESRWMEPTTACRRTYVTSPASSSYFSRTVLRRTVLVRRSWTRNSWFHLAGFMAAEQPRPQSNRRQNLNRTWCTKRFYQTKVQNVDDLRQLLIDVWNGTEHGVIGDAIDQWRRRLCVCVQAKGGH